jgi:hypothetical protein
MFEVWRFNYIQCRAEELFLNPGTYQLEVWGASGGIQSSSYPRGLGGYSKGVLTLRERTKVFVRLGGQGSDTTNGIGTEGCNGGGYTTSYARSGGGSTDIRLKFDSLHSHVIVAGGGGGTGDQTYDSGGHGGGLNGGNGGYYSGYTSCHSGKGGGQQTETTACYNGIENTCPKGTFGYGRNTTGSCAGAGGGGWFGGSASNQEQGGGGGSGYVFTESSAKVGGYLLGEEFYLTNTSMQNGVNSGNGYASIIFFGNLNYSFNQNSCYYKYNTLSILYNIVSLLISTLCLNN